MSSQPKSIDARVVLVTDANRSRGGRQTATRKARPLFATVANAEADESSAGFGDVLRDHRRAAGLTQEQLAERAGVSQRSISDMERGGAHVPRRDTVTLLVRALGLARPEREVFEGLVERSRRLRPMPDRPAIYHPPLSMERVVERPKHNLQRSLTSLVGREQELAELDRLVATAPLLTLVGTGGIGKTRLAQELVRHRVASYPDGSWLIELARLADPLLVPSAVAEALGLHDIKTRNITSTLAEYLRPLKLLLVLDNCEHLVEACAELVATLLRTCPHLQVVATSREPLAIAGEVTWRVPPLELPEPYAQSSPEQIMLSAAVRLFIERAQAVNDALVLTLDNLRQVARICIGVDGIPLALELAAAHARVLPVEQLAQRLECDSALLGRTIRTGPPEHQNHARHPRLEPPVARRAGASLVAPHVGLCRGWTLPLRQVVCSGAGVNAAHILCLLTRLVDKSMVLVDAAGALGRYRLLEPIRHYALERLAASGEATKYWARRAAASGTLHRSARQSRPSSPRLPRSISSKPSMTTCESHRVGQ